MANLPTILLAQTLTLLGEISLSVTDSTSTRTITLVAAATTKYGRIYLASRSATGTAVGTPLEVLDELEGLLNVAPGATHWTVRLTTAGVVKITYVGGSGTGTITWTANGLGLRNLLGFTGAATAALAVGGSTTAIYPPGGTIVGLATGEDDSDWGAQAGSVAVATSADGRTYAIDSGYQQTRRTVTIRMLPSTWAYQGAGEYFTPCFPADTAAAIALWSAPGLTDYLLAPPYSAHQFIATAHRSTSAALGISLGDLQSIISGALTDFDVGYLDAETVRAAEMPLSVPGWKARRDLPLIVTRTSKVTR